VQDGKKCNERLAKLQANSRFAYWQSSFDNNNQQIQVKLSV